MREFWTCLYVMWGDKKIFSFNGKLWLQWNGIKDKYSFSK